MAASLTPRERHRKAVEAAKKRWAAVREARAALSAEERWKLTQAKRKRRREKKKRKQERDRLRRPPTKPREYEISLAELRRRAEKKLRKQLGAAGHEFISIKSDPVVQGVYETLASRGLLTLQNAYAPIVPVEPAKEAGSGDRWHEGTLPNGAVADEKTGVNGHRWHEGPMPIGTDRPIKTGPKRNRKHKGSPPMVDLFGEPLEPADQNHGWTKEACDDWQARYGGAAPGGWIGRALKSLVEKESWPAVRAAWQNYLGQTPGTYASPVRFAATYGEWRGGQRSETERKNGAALAQWLAEQDRANE